MKKKALAVGLAALGIVGVLAGPALAHVPNCVTAKASPDELWPPNHKFRTVTITGIGITDRDPILSITIDSVLQDEPVNDIGDGNTAPDAQRVSGKGQVQVRAERSGALQNGRVYIIGFTATDDDGPCSGTATVCVPHDQSKKKPRCVDDGVRYDSFTGAQVS